jgi:hypothetical protein
VKQDKDVVRYDIDQRKKGSSRIGGKRKEGTGNAREYTTRREAKRRKMGVKIMMEWHVGRSGRETR